MTTLHPANTHLNAHATNLDKFGTAEGQGSICPDCEAEITQLLRKVGGTDVRLLRGLEMNSVRREWISLLQRQLWVRHHLVLAKLNSGEDVLYDDDESFHKEIDAVVKSIEQQHGS